MKGSAVDFKKEICAVLAGSWDEASVKRRAVYDAVRAARHVCLFGAGEVGQAVAYDLAAAGIRVDCFCDNNSARWGTCVQGAVKCLSVADLVKIKDDAVVLVTSGYFREIGAQLKGLGFTNYHTVSKSTVRKDMFLDKSDVHSVQQSLVDLLDVLADDRSKEIVRVVVESWFSAPGGENKYKAVMSGDQYFPADVVTLSDREVFVDAGAFNGDTIRDFLSRVGNRFERIVAYELDRHYFEKLQESLRGLDEDVTRNIQAFNVGLYDENMPVKYQHNLTSSSVNANADEWGNVVRLSDHQRGARISFVKMDIEGAEIKALQGSAEIIGADRPKLAICTYHELSHLWEIPLYIKTLDPSYEIRLRHHSDMEYETVCYATRQFAARSGP